MFQLCPTTAISIYEKGGEEDKSHGDVVGDAGVEVRGEVGCD